MFTKKKIKKVLPEKFDPRITEAIELFNQRKFREALLKFEEPWKDTWGQEERFLRALIQIAGAFHHFSENRLESALALYQSSTDLLSNYLPKYQKLDVASLLEGLHGAFAELADKGTKSNVTLDRNQVPKMTILE